jgi:hypothetical protein
MGIPAGAAREAIEMPALRIAGGHCPVHPADNEPDRGKRTIGTFFTGKTYRIASKYTLRLIGVPKMSTAERYRKLAVDLVARSHASDDLLIAGELQEMARWYFRLASQAERNSAADVWAEFGPRVVPERDANGRS